MFCGWLIMTVVVVFDIDDVIGGQCECNCCVDPNLTFTNVDPKLVKFFFI